MISYNDIARGALGWWGARINAETGAARALRAKLRRADSPAEVLAHQDVADLAPIIEVFDPDRLSLIARALAGLNEHKGGQRIARVMGRGGETRAVSELRFQKIIRAADPADLTTPLLRALPMINRACDVASLAADLARWDEATRARWCFQYFGERAPDQLSAEKEDEGETA